MVCFERDGYYGEDFRVGKVFYGVLIFLFFFIFFEIFLRFIIILIMLVIEGDIYG